MVTKKRRLAMALLTALALASACEVASAAQPGATTTAPSYTLVVVSDAPQAVSFETIAVRLGAELGQPIDPTGTASRVAITIHYRASDHELTVRAAHVGGPTLERTVKSEGDDAAVLREAILLTGNLARTEAREILDALANRPEPRPSEPTEPASAKEPPVDEPDVQVSAALFYPLATNFGRPYATSHVDLSLLYGRVGHVGGVQLGSAVTYASRGLTGVQFGAAVNVAGGGDASGAQVAGVANVSGRNISGAQVAGAFNLALGKVEGTQVAGALNIAGPGLAGVQLAPINIASSVSGAQLGIINIGRRVKGAQLGLINIAEEVDGVSLGLVSITKDGIHPIAWTSNLASTNAGVKFSTKYVYTVIAATFSTLETDFDDVGTTTSLGTHVPLPDGLARFDLDVEASFTSIVPTRPNNDETNMWLSGHVLPGYSFARHLRAFAGGGARFPLQVEVGRSVVRPEVLLGVQF